MILTFSSKTGDYIHNKKLRACSLLIILILIIVIPYIVYLSGGTKNVLPHLMYIPIILSALFFGTWGAVAAALVGGLALGPFIPENVMSGTMQSTFGWIVRCGFFTFMGLLVAFLFKWIIAYGQKEKERSTTNLITGLPNANKLDNDLNDLLSAETGFTLLGFRVENVDDINRYASYEIGIKSLFVAISKLRNFTEGTIYSIYMNEFAIVVTGMEFEDAWRIGNQFLDKMKEPLSLDGFNIALVIKCGLVHCPQQAQESSDIIKKLGIALDHETKGSGLQVYDDLIAKERKERFNLAVSLLDAIRNEEFYLVYQPKIALADDKPVGVEVLLRWHRGDGLHIGPDVFISMAEELGIISDISKWVIRNAIAQAVQWKNAMQPIEMAINLSPKDLKTPAVVYYLIDLIKENALDPSLVEVELTERAVIEVDETMLRMIETLRELGVSISLDDFGTGYNSLVDLVAIPFDFIKIDKSFVDNIRCDDYQVLIDIMIAYAHKSGKKVIAEGVEGEVQLNILRKMGCDFVQGYYFSKPLPLNELEVFFSNQPHKQNSVRVP